MFTWAKIKSYDLEVVNFMVGAVVLTFELTAARIITPFIGNTTYTWTSIIGVILAALAAGYALGGRLADRRKNKADIVLLLLVATACILFVNLIKDGVLREISHNRWPMQMKALLAGLSLFALPTVLLGAISPYLTRLRLENLKTSGQLVARMSAWGTAGSLFGTFSAGYLLFGYVGTRTVVILLAATLLLLTFVLSFRDYLPYRVAVLLGIVGAALLSGPISIKDLVTDTDTRYSRVIIRDVVREGRPVRVLQTDGMFFQSGEYKDNSKDLVFGYTRILDFASRLRPQQSNMLIIGGGAYTLPSHFARTMPDTQVDTVEIDDGLKNLSEQYFGFRQASNLKIYNQDGRAFLNLNKTDYDMIILDAYASVVPPYQLLTKEAIIEMKNSLKKEGLVAANIISPQDGEPLLNLVKTYKTVFDHVAVLPTFLNAKPSANQNLILLASDKDISREELLAKAASEEEKLSAGRMFLPDTTSSIVMTDDFAPIERYSVSNL